MYRIIIPAFLILLLLVSPTIAAEFEVIQTDVQLQQAVLYNPDTGEQRVYKIDEEIDGWRIEEIAPDSITLSHSPINIGEPILMKTIPIKNPQKIIKVTQTPEK